MLNDKKLEKVKANFEKRQNELKKNFFLQLEKKINENFVYEYYTNEIFNEFIKILIENKEKEEFEIKLNYTYKNKTKKEKKL